VSGLIWAGSAPAAPNAAVEGVADGGLRAEIEQALGEARAAPRSPLDARRRAIDAARDANALLRSEGYYAAEVTPDIATAPTVRSIVRVKTGPRFKISGPRIDWSPVAPAATAVTAANEALQLSPGAPGRAADILAAEGRVIAALRRVGYADARLLPREVVVDHADSTVRPAIHVESGAVVRLGEISGSGKTRTRQPWLARLAPWKRGAAYDPALLAKMEKRLLDTGVYESAAVSLGPADGALRPVVVNLLDRPRRSLELGASYSTTEGSGADAKFTTFNRLGRGDSLILVAKAYDIQQKLDLELDLPHWLRAGQTLKIGGGFLGDRTSAYDDLGAGLRLDVIRRGDLTNQVFVGASVDFASTREKLAVNLQSTPVGQTLNLFIATTRIGFNLDRSDSLLNPARGWRLELEGDPTLISGDRNLGYVRTQAQVSGYLPLGRGLPVMAARMKLGSIWGGSIPDVPADRRFYAGGGGSVRGYAYQAVGARLSDNTPAGGLSLTEGSLELRQKLSRNWGLVAFADVGAVGGSSTPKFDGLAVGVGAGIRYDLGFGPLRLDIATPVNPRRGDSPVQVYISIGQAF
jgi:translocation and assembly module TamA